MYYINPNRSGKVYRSWRSTYNKRKANGTLRKTIEEKFPEIVVEVSRRLQIEMGIGR